MIYTGLNHTGEVQVIHTHGGGTVEAVYGGINYQNPIFYSRKTLSGTSPLTFKGLGQPLKDYHIFGETVQNGTPTPSDPVSVVGCGELETIGAKAGQYKIPVTIGNVTTPIYLSEVQTTRKIKKLVLTGNEDITLSSTDDNRVVGLFTILNMGLDYSRTGYCNILQWKAAYSQSDYNRIVATSSINFYLSLAKSILPEPTFNGFKSYLAAQYANGTPATIWYILATPETVVVNEPLHKIGDYADTISYAQAGVTISTVAGANTLAVDTTVQPSAVSITGHIKPTGYGQLVDVNDVDIQDSTGEPVYIKG